jgi:hypothetical protein
MLLTMLQSRVKPMHGQPLRLIQKAVAQEFSEPLQNSYIWDRFAAFRVISS